MGVTDSCCEECSINKTKHIRQQPPRHSIAGELENTITQHNYLSTSHRRINQEVLPIKWNGYEADRKKRKSPIRNTKYGSNYSRCDSVKEKDVSYYENGNTTIKDL